MTAKPAPIGGQPRWLWTALLASVLSCAGSPAGAQISPLGPHAETMRFDLAAQALGDALEAYSRMTHISVVVDSRHTTRAAPAVRGAMTPEQALHALLDGSGLQGRYVRSRSVVVEPRPASMHQDEAASAQPLGLASIAGVMDEAGDHRGYAARLQNAVRGALCRAPRTRPGQYRLAMQFGVDARGRLVQLRLLGSSGDARRDAAVQRVLEGLEIGVAGPGIGQPFVFLVVPQSDGGRVDCAAAMAASGDVR